MTAPEHCNICGADITNHFVDGATRISSSWAYMCLRCHSLYGRGFGTGYGQLYEKRDDEWLKVKG